MKPSSPDPAPAAVGRAQVRPARLDRPLSRQLLEPGYADAALEGILAVATARAQEAAQARGYAAGWSHGSQTVTARAAEQEQLRQTQLDQDRRSVAVRGQALLDSLADALRRQQQAELPSWHEVADALTEGALALAAAAIGRELACLDAPMVEAVRVALRALGDPEQVALHLNPVDAAVLDLADLPAGLRLVADASVPAGAVLAQTPAQRLAYNLPIALAAAEKVLRS